MKTVGHFSLSDATRCYPSGLEIAFCLCLFSVFLPFKIYPVVFSLSAVFFLIVGYKQALHLKPFLQRSGLIPLVIFGTYASASYFLTTDGTAQASINFIKMVVNLLFFGSALFWLDGKDNHRLLLYIDRCLHFIFAGCLLQLLVYHYHTGFHLLAGAGSSAKASALYQADYFFWGLADKNMFGARMALWGFAYLLIPIARQQTFPYFRIAWVLLLGYLTLSRTPVVALLIGLLALIAFFGQKHVKVSFFILLAFALPFIFNKLIRLEHLTSSNDGMGVRLTYWKAFFQHFDTISPLGNGFLKGGDFLQQYAAYYHGEPHIHNTFLSCYLELGWLGLVSYSLFLWLFYRYCNQKNKFPLFWLAAFLPLMAIMMILYSGYDNDIMIYLLLIFIIGTTATKVNKPTTDMT